MRKSCRVLCKFVVAAVLSVQSGVNVSAFGRKRGVPLVGRSGKKVASQQQQRLSSGSMAIAGAVATMIGAASLHPVDCIKTLQQSNAGSALNMVGAARKIYSDSGVGGFLSGMGIYVASDGMAGAIKFSTYEGLKKWVRKHTPEEFGGAAVFVCAGIAFLASSVVLVPGELIKQRLQAGQVSSFSQGVSTIWNQHGIRGFYAGYSGVCLRDIPYTMLELGIYDNLKSLYLTYKNRNLSHGRKARPITQMDEILAAAITGGITGYLTCPLDLIKTKLMLNSHLYTGFFDAASKNVRDHGVASLFHGGIARVAWLMPFTAIYLPIYETIKRKMEPFALFAAVPTQHQHDI